MINNQIFHTGNRIINNTPWVLIIIISAFIPDLLNSFCVWGIVQCDRVFEIKKKSCSPIWWAQGLAGERQKRKISQYKVMNIGLWMHRRGNK